MLQKLVLFLCSNIGCITSPNSIGNVLSNEGDIPAVKGKNIASQTVDKYKGAFMGDTKVIFVGNYKGGVGKTTSVLNFAEHFTKMGKKVLVLDLDPQSSLSEILVSNNGGALNTLSDEMTLNYVFDLHISKVRKYNNIELKFKDNIIQTYQKRGYDFIASSLFYRENLGLDELAIRMEDNIEYLSILKGYLDSIIQKKRYDFIIMDCPPSNNLITKSAFLISDYYIIPTILDKVSANGVAHYIKTVNETYEQYCQKSEDSILARHYFGDKPKLLGVFCTFIRGQVNYKKEFTEMKAIVDTACKEEIFFFEEEVNNFIDIARSTEVGEASKARNDYEKLSKSVLEIINNV